ncbi:MAG: bifunctional 3,4-dihydroxy-2-butanone-4-phosphate synthase/GTP cyclohydrolase II [Acidimicrobiia bacterium]
MKLTPIPEAVEAIGRGEFVLVVDDAGRENEGDMVIAAEKVTEAAIAFMVRYTSGLICMPVVGERLDELRLPLMVTENTAVHHTAFTVSIDAKEATTTGISAADRAATIKAVLNPSTRPEDLSRPGHIFPLRYAEGGVLRRAGHTEAAVDLAKLAGLYPAGVICEVVNDDGTMARGEELEAFANQHDLAIISIADLIRHRSRTEKLVRRLSEARLPTAYGEFRAVGFESLVDGRQHIALVMGEVSGTENVLVRVHSECLTGDTFGSVRCDCGFQLRDALHVVGEEGRGIVLYIRGHEGRGIGLMHKLAAYALQDEGRDTVEANVELGFPPDARDYGVGAQILVDLGITTIRLLTNNPTKRAGIEGYGLKIVDRVPLQTAPTDENRAYLETKAGKLGHLISLDDESS